MTERDMIPFGAAIAGDILSAFGPPGGNTLVTLATALVQKKRREAADILIQEISNGHHGHIDFDAHDVDPLIDIVLRFSKAVADGSAKENLRLLAQVIAGLKKYRALDGDKFQRWCGILEHLTRDELLVIGIAYTIRKKIETDKTTVANDFWQQLQHRLDQAGYKQDEISALCASVSRTGLLVPASAFGGMAYSSSTWLQQLGELANLEAEAVKSMPK
jgi:hypothetical protein